MNKFMPQICLKLILFLILTGLLACQDQTVTVQASEATFKQLRSGSDGDRLDSVRRFKLGHPTGRFINTILLVSMKEHEVGLSGIKNNDFKENEGALFWYPDVSTRRFWMPDTYFNLDLFFLDGELRVVDIDRNLLAHPGKVEPPPIMFSKTVRARHVLELRADSAVSKEIKIGDQLQVLSPLSLSQIESKIHQQQ